MENKKICPTHYLRYTGRVCPYCEKERIDRMKARFEKKETKVSEDTAKEESHYTMEDLINKFKSE